MKEAIQLVTGLVVVFDNDDSNLDQTKDLFRIKEAIVRYNGKETQVKNLTYYPKDILAGWFENNNTK